MVANQRSSRGQRDCSAATGNMRFTVLSVVTMDISASVSYKSHRRETLNSIKLHRAGVVKAYLVASHVLLPGQVLLQGIVCLVQLALVVSHIHVCVFPAHDFRLQQEGDEKE